MAFLPTYRRVRSHHSDIYRFFFSYAFDDSSCVSCAGRTVLPAHELRLVYAEKWKAREELKNLGYFSPSLTGCNILDENLTAEPDESIN